MRKIPLLRPFFDREEVEEITQVLHSGWVTQGPKSQEFEERAKKYLGVRHAIAVANCTAALHLALLSIGIKKGDDVLVADYTYPATGHAVVYCGARPRFVDVDGRTYNMDPEKLKQRLTKRTKAIIPVHTFGQPADMDPIIEFAEKHNLKVIEDAACAFGARYKKRQAGTMGDVGCFSFHARKGLTTGEGGMVVTNDEKLAERIRHLSVFGLKAAWAREGKKFQVPTFTDIGYNYKLSDIAAAIGVVQLRRLDKVLARKRQLAKQWGDILADMKSIAPPYVSKNVEHVFQTYTALVGKKIDRNNVIDGLASYGVQANIGTYSSYIQPVYKSRDRCPVSLEIFNRALALPLYYGLKESEIDEAGRALKKVLK